MFLIFSLSPLSLHLFFPLSLSHPVSLPISLSLPLLSLYLSLSHPCRLPLLLPLMPPCLSFSYPCLSFSLSVAISLPPPVSLPIFLPADHGIGGLLCHCLVARSPWFIFLLYTYDYLYFILFSFQIVSSFVRDSSYHDMYYKGCGLLCAHKKPFNTAIPVRSLGPYIIVHYIIVHILV